jgi:phosphohistidine swiveling domain-containing protein
LSGAFIIVHLSEVPDGDLILFGGKATNLGRLKSNGFSVPDGFVVTTEAYRLFLAQTNLSAWIDSEISRVDFGTPESLESATRRIRSKILSAELPSAVVEELKAKYSPPTNAVAVRSSAVGEDLSFSSFAGQMDTSLNVKGVADVVAKIKLCYASLWTARAVSYRHQRGLGQTNVAMAVIVQVMASSRSAGVMFTANPVSGDTSEIVIESNWGLGESVVSGNAEPDMFTLKNSSKGYDIVVREIGLKSLIANASQSGIDYLDSGSLAYKASLNDEELIRLAEIGDRIEAAFGAPQDVEWAIDSGGGIHILQSRPITAVGKIDAKDEIVWSRGYSDDYWNDSVSPLFFELLGDYLTKVVNLDLNKIMGYSGFDSPETSQLLILHKAHVYFNLEVLKRKVENEIPGFLRSEDLLNYFPEGGGRFGKATVKAQRFNVWGRIWAEISVTFKDPDGGASRTAKVYDEWTQQVFNAFYENFDSNVGKLKASSLTDLMHSADEVNDIMLSHFRLVRYGIPVHNIGMNLLTQYLLSRWVGELEARRVYPILVSGLKHKTSETNARINDLATAIRKSPELKEIIVSKPSKAIYEYISASNSPDIRWFTADFDRFQKDLGFRGFTREVYYSRWSDSPELVFDLLKPLASGEIIDFKAADKRNLELKAETDLFVESRIKSGLMGFAKWKLFSGILSTARRYIIFRELQRFNLDKWISMCRCVYMEIGSRFASQGLIEKPAEVFFFKKDEIRSVAYGGLTSGDLEKLKVSVKERKDAFIRYENTTPPKFLQGEREYNDPPPPDSLTLHGIPASQGVLTALVRVLYVIDNIWQVQAGEIIVVPRTDPGWTPVFGKIGGLITETGGVLSHGAVVAREYGIPAVTNVREACRLLQTGMKVTIDGVKGEVQIVEE